MKDIEIKNNDLLFENGDLVLVSGEERIVQQVKVGLKILKGDWFLDYRKGIDYFNGLKAYSDVLKAEIKQAIKEVNGVENVLNYTFVKKGQEFSVSATLSINNKLIGISEGYVL